MFDYIFLDLDGPVLEGKYRHYECYKHIINKFGGEPLDIETYWNLKRNKISREVILSKSKFQGSYKDFYQDWIKTIENQNYLNLDLLKPNVVEVLLQWKTISFSITLVTMRQKRENLISQLNSLKIRNLFDEIIDCPPNKPDTKYEALKNKIFSNAIFIGDTEEDAKTAKLLNVKFIGVTNGLRSKEFLNANYYYEDIKDINLIELL